MYNFLPFRNKKHFHINTFSTARCINFGLSEIICIPFSTFPNESYEHSDNVFITKIFPDGDVHKPKYINQTLFLCHKKQQKKLFLVEDQTYLTVPL